MALRVAPDTWLSVTPEPERELPAALATLRHGGIPTTAAIEHERERIERIVLHGNQRDWLAHLSEAVRLIETTEDDADPAVVRARDLAIEVIANHHNLLLGLPGTAAQRTAGERKRLGGSA
ncbi:MAG TPA: hypothetical protein VGF74_20155 [Thermoleophilaceae bacterium]|jgi:hypothetical protein